MPAVPEPDPRRVEILHEGDADEPVRVPIADQGAGPPPPGHVVGRDPLGSAIDAVASIADPAAPGRVPPQQRPPQPFFWRRAAQVVQATRVPFETVSSLLGERVAEADGLRLGARVGRGAGEVVFAGRLGGRRGRGGRRVRLRIYPTPSANLTILELLPERRWMPQTDRYLRRGVPAVSDLTDRIEAAAAGGRART